MNVYIDSRWPEKTGIGRMYRLYSRLAPPVINQHELALSSGIGSVGSFGEISLKLLLRKAKKSSDVFWNPGFVPARTLGMRSVVTVHDLMHLYTYSKKHIYYYNYVFKPLYKSTDLIICVSNFTRNEFLNWSGIDSSRVVVVHNAIDPLFSRQGEGVLTGKPYIFYPGNRRKNKNLPLLVNAFLKGGLNVDFDLCMTGQLDQALFEIAKTDAQRSSLKFLGDLTEAELVVRYKNARCLAFISSYEGFGLPILEAMQCGIPVLSSNRTSLPEVGGDAVLYADPDDEDNVQEGMQKICYDDQLRSRLIKNGTERLKHFDLEVSAASTWTCISGNGIVKT